MHAGTIYPVLPIPDFKPKDDTMNAQTPISTTKKKRVRNMEKMSSQMLRDYINHSGQTLQQIATALGSSVSGLSGWANADQMPRIVGVAIEGLQRRVRQEKTVVHPYIIIVPDGANSAFEHFAKALHITIQKIPNL